MNPVYTVGHGARTADDFNDVLIEAKVQILLDVRRFPGSRRYPHFSREALHKSLRDLGIGYEWWGENLGGRRAPSSESRHPALRNASFRAYADHMESAEFQAALARVEARSKDERLAVMCAETLWWRCHRRLIADALVARGFEVIHLGAGKDAVHALTPGARVDEDGLVVYDAGEGRAESLF